MRQIGFKNFRRFEDFPVIDINPITIFVGENNAGKSTVVKAMLSVLDFLNSSMFEELSSETFGSNEFWEKVSVLLKEKNFYFNKNYYAHIGTFSRAIYNKSKGNTITFSITIDNRKYTIVVEGNKKDTEAISGKVISVKVHNAEYNIDIAFDFKGNEIIYTFHPGVSPIFVPSKPKEQVEEAEDESEEDEFDQKYRKYQEERQKILKEYGKYSDSFSRDVIVTTDFKMSPMHSFSYQYVGNLLTIACEKLLDTIADENEEKDEYDVLMGHRSPKKKIIIEDIPEATLQFLLNNKRLIKEMLKSEHMDMYLTDRFRVEYFYAHAVMQTIIYSAKDTNDYLVKTIHEFANARIAKGSKADKFIKKWMSTLGIGCDYDLSSVGGEAHLVKIEGNDGTLVNLSDKGMGSIQLMVLLFRIATFMGRRGNGQATIIIEEPEQNLHPSLQSKLADLFYELNSKYHFNFIIETHSEYLVRRSQVIVAKENKKASKDKKKKEWTNPFKVYYFPADGHPYDMEYASDGYFEKSIGKGFFNVSSELSLDLDRVEQGIYDEGQD